MFLIRESITIRVVHNRVGGKRAVGTQISFITVTENASNYDGCKVSTTSKNMTVGSNQTDRPSDASQAHEEGEDREYTVQDAIEQVDSLPTCCPFVVYQVRPCIHAFKVAKIVIWLIVLFACYILAQFVVTITV